MLRHRMSVWFQPGHDEELARAEALEEWFQQVFKRGYEMAKHPRVHLVQERSGEIRGTSAANRARRMPGYRVCVQGDIKPIE